MRRKARRGGARQAVLDIETLGARGDGVGRLDGRPVFVAGVLPGERARVQVTGERDGALRGEAIELLSESPSRVAPPCPHFGLCGGCALQHLDEAAYRDWKRGLVVEALARRGLTGAEVGSLVGPLVSVPPGTRRRATLAAYRGRDGRVHLGFHETRGHAVVDLTACLILHPRLFALLAPLRGLLGTLLAGGGRAGARAGAALTLTETGVDLLLTSLDSPDLEAREAMAAFAEARDLARLSWSAGEGKGAEPVALRRAPRVRFSGVAVTPPPGGFLQPTAEGEAALVDAVLRGLPKGAERFADLYAGCGTFTFALASRGRVHAVEGDSAALEALSAAARAAGLDAGIGGRVEAEVRDLARQPLMAAELGRLDALVFDPPRAGARAQAEQIAASRLPAVVAVSCNPHTFARDARLLVDGGFELLEVTPIDQFAWTGHLELVAIFRR